MADILTELVAMSRMLGEPTRDYVILNEGNTSARVDADTLWVQASGVELAQATADSFVRVRAGMLLWALDGPTIGEADISRLLKECIADQGQHALSTETFLHALCLKLPDVRFVGHTHPTATLGLLSSARSRDLFAGSLFPDQAAVTGPAYAYVQYAEPGLALALAVRSSLVDFQARYGRSPKVVLMENHGVIALGGTAREVLAITHMFVKACRILVASLAAGGPRFLSAAQARYIDTAAHHPG